MTPREVLERASGQVFSDEEGKPERIVLLPGLTDQEVADLERAVGHALPASVAELVRFASGFTLWGREVDFNCPFQGWLDETFPRAACLSSLDALDDWFIEVSG